MLTVIRLTPPTRSGRVSSTWGKPRAYRDGWHGGLDFPGQRGEPAYAMAGGVVARVNRDASSGGYAGKYVVIDHGKGIHTRVIHLDSVSVSKGQRVRRGHQVGAVGSTGTHSGSPHAHVDAKFTPAALIEYERNFGKPTTGWYREMAPWGHGAPMEPLMDRARYDGDTLQDAMALGVQAFRRSGGWLLPVAIAAVTYLAVRRR